MNEKSLNFDKKGNLAMVTPSPIKKSAPAELPRGSARCSRLPPATSMRPASLLASAWQKF
jgi:hypothetical protein